MTIEFPANEIVRFLVGFTNKGSQDFTVQSLEASFRYPQDFQFYIQNVSLILHYSTFWFHYEMLKAQTSFVNIFFHAILKFKI